jgi:hypothetical protein
MFDSHKARTLSSKYVRFNDEWHSAMTLGEIPAWRPMASAKNDALVILHEWCDISTEDWPDIAYSTARDASSGFGKTTTKRAPANRFIVAAF